MSMKYYFEFIIFGGSQESPRRINKSIGLVNIGLITLVEESNESGNLIAFNIIRLNIFERDVK